MWAIFQAGGPCCGVFEDAGVGGEGDWSGGPGKCSENLTQVVAVRIEGKFGYKSCSHSTQTSKGSVWRS